LNAQADLVAARLIAAGVQPGQIVGLWLPRGIELLVLQAGSPRPAPPGCRSMRTRRSSACRFVSTTPPAPAC
jgi:non-ribosomal peptide synthetase component F